MTFNAGNYGNRCLDQFEAVFRVDAWDRLLRLSKLDCSTGGQVGLIIAVLQAIDVLMSSLVPAIQVTAKDYGTLARVIISSIIWSPCMLQSRRVESTFVPRYREQCVAPVIPAPTTALLPELPPTPS